jgi:hypothetical protein
LEKREVRLCSAKQIVRDLCSAYAKQSEFLAMLRKASFFQSDVVAYLEKREVA